MKKLYSTPEIDIVKLTLKDVILSSPTEGNIPGQGETMPPDPGVLPDLPDL